MSFNLKVLILFHFNDYFLNYVFNVFLFYYFVSFLLLPVSYVYHFSYNPFKLSLLCFMFTAINPISSAPYSVFISANDLIFSIYFFLGFFNSSSDLYRLAIFFFSFYIFLLRILYIEAITFFPPKTFLGNAFG